MLVGNVTNQLHECYRLANAGAAEQSDLAALGNWHDQVDDFNACLEQFRIRSLLFVGRRGTMNRQVLFCTDLAGIVDGLAEHVHDSTQRLLTYGHRNRSSRIGDIHATLQAFR